MTHTYSDAFGMNVDAIEAAIRPGYVVHAERRTGKTTALMHAIHKRHTGAAIVVCPSKQQAEMFASAYCDYVAHGARPVCLGPMELNALKGTDLPLYVDEYWSFSERAQQQMRDYGIAGAVGTLPSITAIRA